ncbi:dihydrolipoyl dehydrogenase family protein [Haloarchaeobius amylolyticus]|uniref:dihydrolipoyl dehydrogenase family protein n=1 Tax=Haloarchaeobius amylolyticus TaxID=1198296 RepID=UPI0022718234|nr:dihydrolipoyl dehydrogenase [Haloarchaeobius amylolyticus]
MTNYDLVVVGGGTGNKVARAAGDSGLETALVSKGPIGGTCLNFGCNPSKMLIAHADAANAVREAGRFGIDATLEDVDFGGATAAVTETLTGISDSMEQGYREHEHVDLYRTEARFVDDRTLALAGEEEPITADRIVVATGSRPLVPPIDGLDEVDYMTNREALRRTEQPDHLVIIGGGYIGAEIGYFYESMGTEVTVVEMLDRLVPNEDREVGEAFTAVARERHTVHTGARVTSVSQDGADITVHAEDETGEPLVVTGDALLVAVGRRPNTDRLDLDATGIETDDRGFLETDEYLQTTVEGVFAMGDVAGNFMFKHSADYEAELLTGNLLGADETPVDYAAMPHAVFTDPQIGGVGETEQALEEAGTEYVVGRATFADTAMGRARKYEVGFAKVLAAPDTGEILGFHVFGDEASTLLHEVVVAKRAGLRVPDLADTVHVHPSLSKVVWKAVRDAESKR